MISPSYVQLMAGYNQWQNENLYAAASTLSDEDRKLDRGAFFKSIHHTLAHILWADQIWMSRIAGFAPPLITDRNPSTEDLEGEWSALIKSRKMLDIEIGQWAKELTQVKIDGDLKWRSASGGVEMTNPRWKLLIHIFNHQTHHRGQVHAMLTSAGVELDATDIPVMPQ